MNEDQNKLKEKIVDLADFFAGAAEELKKAFKFRRIFFLGPDYSSGNFVTKYSTEGKNLRFSGRELVLLSQSPEKIIILPPLKPLSKGFFSKILILKLNWKIRRQKISGLIPIFRGDRMLCLILLVGKISSRRLSRDQGRLCFFCEEMRYCLEEIILYNQALSRLIGEDGGLDRTQAFEAFSQTEKGEIALLGKKAEFL